MKDLKPFLDDMLSMSTGTDGRTLEIHFSRPITKEDRQAFADAHNAIVRGQLSGWQTMDMAEDLMPCPFCGGAPRVMHCGAGTYMVQCVMCKATTDDGRLDRISANWNRHSPETDEDRTYRVLATIAPPDNGTSQEVLSAVLACANAWVPEARIIGNVRAGDIARVLSPIVANGGG